ncbi:MAG TPA: TolC family protein, partial [Kofleriaceae bacterium]|nr:TolC family protein [Kofleriaceae bacterium]
MTHRFAFALTLLAAAPALAQPAQPVPPDDMAAFEKDLDALFTAGGLTADQAAARAGKVSPTVLRKVAELEASTAEATATELQLVPQLNGKLSYTRLSFIPPFTIAIPGVPPIPIQFFQNSYDAQANLVVPISDYVVRFPRLLDAAHLAEDAARANKLSAEVDAGEDARLAYYEWVRARLQVLIAQRQLGQVQATLVQEQSLFDVQRVSKADLMRIQSQEAEAEQTLDQLTNLSELREEQLRLLIGAREDEPLAIGEDIRKDLAAPAVAGLDDLVQRAEHRRLDFRVLDIGIEAKEKQRAAEESSYYPKLSAYGTVEDARPNQRYFPQTDQFKFTWDAGVELTWTLNDALTTMTTRDRLAAETDELRADRENLVRGTRIEVLSAIQAVRIAVHALSTSQKGLAAAEESYRVRRELLLAERATAVELVDAQTDLTRARITALN